MADAKDDRSRIHAAANAAARLAQREPVRRAYLALIRADRQLVEALEIVLHFEQSKSRSD